MFDNRNGLDWLRRAIEDDREKPGSFFLAVDDESDEGDYVFIRAAADEQDEWGALGAITAWGLAALGFLLLFWMLH